MPQQRVARLDAGWAAVLAGTTLLLVLAVIAASAFVRLASAQAPSGSATAIDAARTIRKSAGSVAAAGIAALAIGAASVRATRGMLGAAAGGALALMLMLSLVGLATGIQPPRWAAYANQFGGVLLAGVLGWLSGRAATGSDAVAGDRRLARAALALCVLQAAFGGWIATSTRDPSGTMVILHAAIGMAAACSAAALAIRLSGFLRAALLACILSVPFIGLASALASMPVFLQVAHALLGAALLACVAFADGWLEPGA